MKADELSEVKERDEGRFAALMRARAWGDFLLRVRAQAQYVAWVFCLAILCILCCMSGWRAPGAAYCCASWCRRSEWPVVVHGGKPFLAF